MVKFLPFEATTVLPSDPGHETAVEVDPGACVVAVEVPVVPAEVGVVVVVLATQSGFSYTVRRLPAPQNSVASLAQSLLHSLSSVRTAPVPKESPQ